MRVFFLIAGASLLLAASLTGCGPSASTSEQLAAMQASADAAAAQNLKDGEAYLADIAKQPGIIKLPSGVMYKVVSHGATPGAQPTVSDTVTTHYEGKLVDGKVFDSSFARNEPASFPVGGVIEAWQEVIPLMHVGDEVMLYTPASAAYGSVDKGEIPPNSALTFRIQLLGVQGK
jgi:peptidylprolyl isomerase/FKBP-type peptidyl-prolyl cis-trans isomerase FklB